MMERSHFSESLDDSLHGEREVRALKNLKSRQMEF